MLTYQGGCHCGSVRFEVVGTIEELAVCNCSICAKTGYLHWEVDPRRFTLLTSKHAMRNYQFGTKTAKNYFCENCGVSPFRHSRSAPEMVNINVRCLDGVDAEALTRALPVEHFDGQNWEEAAAKRD
jgi:hypothetical protein